MAQDTNPKQTMVKRHMRWQGPSAPTPLHEPACGMHGDVWLAETWDEVTCKRCLTKPNRGPEHITAGRNG